MKVKDQNLGNLKCVGLVWVEHRGFGEGKRVSDQKVRQEQIVRDCGILKRVNFPQCAVRNLHMILFLEKGVARSDLWLTKMSESYY